MVSAYESFNSMQFSDVLKWKSITTNWSSLISNVQTEMGLSGTITIGDHSFCLSDLISSLERKFTEFLHKCITV